MVVYSGVRMVNLRINACRVKKILYFYHRKYTIYHLRWLALTVTSKEVNTKNVISGNGKKS